MGVVLTVTYGVVVEVLLNPSHPGYKGMGGAIALNGIFYRELGRKIPEKDLSTLNFAYCGNSNIKNCPVKGEIVQIESRPSENISGIATILKPYWTSITPIWNSGHHNAYPDIYQFPEQSTKADLGKDFIENANVKPLSLRPGDILIEGRHGQALRMGGVLLGDEQITQNKKAGDPFNILSISSNTEKKEVALEDLLKDPALLIQLSNHTCKIKGLNTNTSGWKAAPISIDTYKGPQQILISDRLSFVARKEHILFNAKKGIGLSANSVSLSADEYIGLNAKKVYLSARAIGTESEAALLGNTAVDWLKELTAQLISLVDTLRTMPANPNVAIPVVISQASALRKTLTPLQAKLDALKSTQVFIA